MSLQRRAEAGAHVPVAAVHAAAQRGHMGHARSRRGAASPARRDTQIKCLEMQPLTPLNRCSRRCRPLTISGEAAHPWMDAPSGALCSVPRGGIVPYVGHGIGCGMSVLDNRGIYATSSNICGTSRDKSPVHSPGCCAASTGLRAVCCSGQYQCRLGVGTSTRRHTYEVKSAQVHSYRHWASIIIK